MHKYIESAIFCMTLAVIRLFYEKRIVRISFWVLPFYWGWVHI